MIIEIRELPQSQAIKDISINISFEDGKIKNITNTNDVFQHRIVNKVQNENMNFISDDVSSIKEVPIVKSDNMIAPLESSETTNLIPNIDLSKRENKVDSAMTDESF